MIRRCSYPLDLALLRRADVSPKTPLQVDKPAYRAHPFAMLEPRSTQELLALLPPQGSRHLVAIDLAKYIRPAWHGHVNEKRNEPEKVVPTVLWRIAKRIRGRQPTHLVLADDGLDLHRAKLCPKYKANRPPKPQGLVDVEIAVRDILSRSGVAPYRVRGLEADDVLHAAAGLGRRLGIPVVLVTDDKDAEQLVSDAAKVLVWDGDNRVVDEWEVRRKWDVLPTQLVDLFALAGDTADGIPGVHGWGPKTAAQILQSAYPRDIPTLLRDGGHWWVPEKWRKKFVENRDVIRMSYDLARLRGQWLSERSEFRATEIEPSYVADLLSNAAERLSR
jgi:protein Xni